MAEKLNQEAVMIEMITTAAYVRAIAKAQARILSQLNESNSQVEYQLIKNDVQTELTALNKKIWYDG